MQGRYRLYGGAWSRAIGPMMVLAELGLDYDAIAVDVRAGEHRQAAFLEINPAGYLPALTTPEGAHLHESAAIMLYLAERHALGDLVPAPGDPERGRFLSLYFYLTNDIQPLSKRFFFPHRYALRRADIVETRAQARAAAEERWGVLDSLLAKRAPWHLGEQFTIADIQVALWAAYGFEEPDDIVSRFPAVRRIFEGVLARPKSGPCLLRQRREVAAVRTRRKG